MWVKCTDVLSLGCEKKHRDEMSLDSAPYVNGYVILTKTFLDYSPCLDGKILDFSKNVGGILLGCVMYGDESSLGILCISRKSVDY